MEARAGTIPTRSGHALRASLFGAFALTTFDGTEIAISNRRARALLAMLCLTPGEALDRDYASKLLWPGRFQAQARASLRQCLLSLDKLLTPHGAAIVDIARGRIAIDPVTLRSDLGDLEAALAADRAAEGAGLLAAIGNRPLLDQMEVGAPFREWLEGRRRHVESRLAVAVERALAGPGDAMARARLGEAWRACGRAPPGQADGRIRIAVLPFEQHDAIGGPFFLAEGVVEELTARLGGVPQLAVAGRTSVASIAAAETQMTLPEVAAALHVTHLIAGKAQRFAEGIRIDVRLIDGLSGNQLWAGSYEGTVAEAMGSRRTIGDRLIGSVCAALGVEAASPPGRRMTANREAYALYLQGRALTMRTIGDGVLANAVERLEQALAIDPDFPECWTALAEAHLYVATFTPALDRVERAGWMADCARKAIALDPSQAYARSLLGVYEFTNHNAVAALDLAHEAYRLAPDESEVAVRLGGFLLFLGHARAALPYIEAAIDRDPVHGRNYAALCAAHMCLGDIDQAIAAARVMADLGFPAGLLAIAYAAKGEHERAIEIYYGMRTLFGSWIMRPPGMPPIDDAARDAYFMLAARGVCGGDPEARANYCRMLDALHQVMPDRYDMSIAYPAIFMGHAELVMKIYGEQPNLSNLFGLMNLWVDLDPTRRTWQHPDFMAFAERIGFVAAWEKYGWPDLMPADPRTN